MNLQDLKTPCLILDIERVRRNAARVCEIARRNNARLRPHIKTHKCVEVARIQTAGQDGALTVSTLAEAEAFARHGFSDFTYAVPIEPGKFDAVTRMIRGGVRLNIITDSTEIPGPLNDAARAASVTIPVFLKVDCGSHRCGVEPQSEEAVEIPRQISASPNLKFAGIL
ncbi:MAG TPA: alanine racemase, partial [Pyrinomonadaceae bacterium]|nr:alanine racemase [Pyrinomonadaceae bacterium]